MTQTRPRLGRTRLSRTRLVGRSLVRRLITLAAAWSLALLAVGGVALSLIFNQASLSRFDDDLADTVDGLLAGTALDHGEVTPATLGDPRTLRVYSGEYWQISTPDAAGRMTTLVRSRSLWDHTLPPPPGGAATLEKSAGHVVYYNSPGPRAQVLRVAALQGQLPDFPTPVIFLAAEDRSPVDQNDRKFDTMIAGALSFLGIGLILAVVIQVRVGLRPLFALSREVSNLRTGKSERVSGDYPQELAPLAQELNALMAHNQEAVERQRTHVGNLAHALKTPISVILTEASQTQGTLADLVTRQAQLMSQQVDHHLRRARAAARAAGQGERTAVAPVLDELSRTLEKIFQGKVRIDWDCDADVAFVGERHDLLEIIGNVMENACKWGKSLIRVTATSGSGHQLCLAVEDDGSGLLPEQRAEVLRRGARMDETAPGSGLGLSIVDELVRAYGGNLTLSDSALGGLRVDLTLPMAELES